MVTLLLALGLVGAEPSTGASWIWFPEEAAVEGAGQTRYFRCRLELAQTPRQVSLRVRWDDGGGRACRRSVRLLARRFDPFRRIRLQRQGRRKRQEERSLRAGCAPELQGLVAYRRFREG